MRRITSTAVALLVVLAAGCTPFVKIQPGSPMSSFSVQDVAQAGLGVAVQNSVTVRAGIATFERLYGDPNGFVEAFKPQLISELTGALPGVALRDEDNEGLDALTGGRATADEVQQARERMAKAGSDYLLIVKNVTFAEEVTTHVTGPSVGAGGQMRPGGSSKSRRVIAEISSEIWDTRQQKCLAQVVTRDRKSMFLFIRKPAMRGALTKAINNLGRYLATGQAS